MFYLSKLNLLVKGFYGKIFLLITISYLLGLTLIVLPSNQTSTKNGTNLASDSKEVLATTTRDLQGAFIVNVPTNLAKGTIIGEDLNVLGQTTISGNLTVNGNYTINASDGVVTASNLLYSITEGDGISIAGGQNPVVTNSGVLSLQDQTGALSLVAGDGISIDGLTISNSAQGSSQDTFKTIEVGSSSFSAGSSADTITFAAGSGIGIAIDTTNKKLTFTNSGASSAWTESGGDVYLSTVSNDVGIGTNIPDSKLHVAGTFKATGEVTLENYTGLNAVLFATNGTGVLAQATTASTGLCLTSGASSPVWASCDGSPSVNVWQISGGTIQPGNTTLDLLVGGSSSASAKFGVVNVNSGTPTATLSAGITGGTYITADGTIQTTANQTLNLGGATTGNIVLSPLGGSGTVSSTGDLNLLSSKVFTINGVSVLSSSTLGSGVTSSSLTTVGALATGSIASGFGTISTDNTITTTATLTGATVNAATGTLQIGGTSVIDASRNLVNIGTTQFNSGTYVWPLNGTGQSSGYALVTDGSGNLSWSGTSGFGTNYFTQANGTIYPTNTALDLLLGGNSSASAKFAVLNISNGTPTASVSAGDSGGAYLSATGTLQTTSNQSLTIGGSTTGDITLSPRNGSGIITLASGTVNTTQSTFNLVNSTATTVNFAGAATTINLGSSAGSSIQFNQAGNVLSASSYALTLDSGTTGAVNLGTGNNSKTINIGTGNAGNTLNLGTNSVADSINIGSSADTVNITGSTNITLGGSNLNITGLTSGSGNAVCVNGSYNLVTCTAGAGGIAGAGKQNRLAFYTDTSTITYHDNLYFDDTTTKLGIGTTSPGGTLDVASSNYPTTIAATYKGIAAPTSPIASIDFRSGIAGVWTSSYDTTETDVQTFTIDTNNQVIYAGSGNNGLILRCELSTSCDTSGDWTTAYDTTEIDIYSIIYDSINETLYAGTGTNGLILKCSTSSSCDTSGDWAIAYDTAYTSIRGFGIDTDNEILYVGTQGPDVGRVLRCDLSTGCDTSGEFSVAFTDDANTFISSFIYETAGDVLYFGAGFGSGDGQIFRCPVSSSCDEQTDFTEVYDGSRPINQFAIDTVNQVLYATEGSTSGGSLKRCVLSSGCDSSGEFANAYTAIEAFAVTYNPTLSSIYLSVGDGEIEVCATSSDCNSSGDFSASLNTVQDDVITLISDNSTGQVFAGTNDGGVIYTLPSTSFLAFAQLQALASDSTTGSEDGTILLKGYVNGTNTELLRIQNSNVGIGSSNPLGKFVVDSKATGKALVILNETGNQDILTASASGVTRFKIANDGTLTASAYTTNGGLLFTNASGVIAQTGTGNGTQCLLGGTTPVWGSCSTGESDSPFQIGAGIITASNPTVDFLLGGVSTSSAKFAVLGIDSDTPVASISALSSGLGMSMGYNGVIQTTRNQTLTLGGNTTGNITLSPRNGSGTVTVDGTLSAKTGRGATKTVAASDSEATVKLQADYVADGAGGTDDATTIESAISALPAGGGSIILLDGTYYLDSDIDIVNSNVIFSGSGKNTVLLRQFDEASALSSGVITIGDDGTTAITNVTVSNLYINGDKSTYTNANNHGILLREEISYSAIKDVTITNGAGVGIQFDSASSESVDYMTIKDNVISSNTGNGIDMNLYNSYNLFDGNTITGNADGINIASTGSNALGNTFTNNTISSNGGDGIEFNNTHYNRIANNNINSNTALGIYFSGSATNNVIADNSIDSNNSYGIRLHSSSTNNNITGNSIRNNTNYGVYITSTSTSNNISGNSINGNQLSGVYLAANNNIISSNTISSNTSSGVQCNAADYNQVTGNYLYANSSHAINFSSCNNNTISSNKLYDNGGSGANHSINLSLADDNNVVSNNDIKDSAGTGSAISIGNSNCDNNILSGNTFSGTGATSISDSGTGTTFNSQQANSSLDISFSGSGGKLGIGTTSPTGQLHVTRASSLAATGKALAIFDQTENQDIFAASSSGTPRFAITNDGGIKLGTDVGSNGNCLLSGGAGSAASWGSCGSGSSSWVLNAGNGTISPINNTLDFLLGGTATASAKFAVLNTAGAGPAIATVSGNMIVMPVNGAGGFLGINNPNPTRALDIVGSGYMYRGQTADATGSENQDVLKLEYDFRGTGGAAGTYAGSGLNVRSYFGAESSNAVGTAHGISSHMNVISSGDSANEYTPLFLDLSSDAGGRLWGGDINIHGPYATQANILQGLVTLINNYNASTITNGGYGGVITTRPTAGGGDKAGDRNTRQTYTLDAGFAITGWAGPTSATNGNHANAVLGFDRALQIGGKAGGWMGSSEVSKFGTGIDLRDFVDYGIYIHDRHTSAAADAPAIAVASGAGLVGVGTTTPGALLHVNGGQWGGKAALIVNQTGSSSNDILTASASGTTRLTLNNSGDLLPGSDDSQDIGSSSLHWDCVYYDATTLGTCSSDERLKGNIQDLSFGANQLEQLSALQPRTFTWNNDPNQKINYGFIAQEVQSVSPDLVTTDENGYLQVKYGYLQYLTVGAIKELNLKVDSIELEQTQTIGHALNEITNLDTRVLSLGERLDSFITTPPVAALSNEDSDRINDIASSVENIDGEVENILTTLSDQSERLSALEEKLNGVNPYSLTPFATESASFSTINDGLLVLGTTSLGDLSVNTRLAVGNTFMIENNSINTLADNTLEIQSLRQSDISFLGGLISFEKNGKVTIEKDLDVIGKIRTSNLSGIDGPLAISGSATLEILGIQRSEAAQSSNSATTTINASAGKLTLKSGTRALTVNSNKAKADSLIFITSTKSTRGQSLFIEEQEDNVFKVAIDEAIDEDIEFNFLIVN